MRGGLQSLLEGPNDALLLKNINNCAKDLGNELITTKVALDEKFPFDILVGQGGIAGYLKKYTDIIFDTPTISVQYSGYFYFITIASLYYNKLAS